MKWNGLVRTVVSGCMLPSLLGAQTTERVSVQANGAEAYLDCFAPSISADGRFVAFESETSFVPFSESNGFSDVFVRDRLTGTTEWISAASNGAPGSDWSAAGVISGDGRFVAFMSYASNLVPHQGSDFGVYLRDRVGLTTKLVSVSTSGAAGNDASQYPAISADGRFVAFTSYASNFVAGDTPLTLDVFVRDCTAGTTDVASLTSTGTMLGGGPYIYTFVGISGDGRCVAFASDKPGFVPGDTNGKSDILVRDRSSQTTERVSVTTGGGEGDGHSTHPVISGDGRFVAFYSEATNIVPGDTNAARDAFVHDRSSGTTERVSVATGGAEGNAGCNELVLAISNDGRFVAFCSSASNLVVGDNNSASDIFVRDRLNGTTRRVSLGTGDIEGNGPSGIQRAALSSDGRYVAFDSRASNLVLDSNGVSDVFVRDRGGLYPGAFCTAGTTTNACTASITGAGTPSASSGSGFTLAVSGVEGQKTGLIFYGIDNTGYAAAPWGTTSSFLCVKPPTQRTSTQSTGGTSNACNGALTLDWNAFIAANPSSLGAPFAAGQRVFAQAWFRDPPSPKTTNLSNALEFVVGP